MGRIGKLLSFVRATRNGAKVSDVKLDPGGGPNITGEHYSAPGDDSFPLDADYVITNEVEGTGREDVVGYADTLNTPKALEGDKRIYARDPATGLTVVEVWLKSDGTALVSNANGSVTLRPDGGSVIATPLSTLDADADGSIAGTNGSGDFELQAGGDFVVNGVTIAANGAVTIPSSLTLNSKEIAEHDHSQGDDSGGDTQVDTGPNN